MRSAPTEEDFDNLACAAEVVLELMEIRDDIYDEELSQLFRDLVALRNSLRLGGHRGDLQSRAGLESRDPMTISAMLKTLQGYNIAVNYGRGEPWKHSSRK